MKIHNWVRFLFVWMNRKKLTNMWRVAHLWISLFLCVKEQLNDACAASTSALPRSILFVCCELLNNLIAINLSTFGILSTHYSLVQAEAFCERSQLYLTRSLPPPICVYQSASCISFCLNLYILLVDFATCNRNTHQQSVANKSKIMIGKAVHILHQNENKLWREKTLYMKTKKNIKLHNSRISWNVL